MTKQIQRSVFESLLVTHGGEFVAAYEDLKFEFGESVVSDSLAKTWEKAFTTEQKKSEGGRQLALLVAGDGLDTRVMAFQTMTPEQKLSQFDRELMSFGHALVADHGHEIFEPKDRIAGIPKVAELLGAPQRIQQAKRNTPQQAHREVQHVASVFGTLTDRQVMTLYVQDNQDVERLTNTLRTMDPEQLATLTPASVQNKLREWQRRGVVVDSEGNLEEWDVVVDRLRHSLKTLPGA